ncbi:MAG: HAD family hydrolase [Mogibacterium sp.]|nr:HAD family hydrolase [Mogibacterium sp.]
MKKYVIFDFDGTLINTNDVIVGSWQATYDHYLGRRVSRKEIELSFGETLVDTIRKMIPGADVDEVVDYYRTWQKNHQKEMVTIYEGIRELLDQLRNMGCVIGVGTSRTSASFWNYMRQFGMEDTVDEVVTMDDVTRHKPHPDTVNVVLARMAGLPEGSEIPEEIRKEAIMLGDTRFDIGCATNAGVDSVLVTWGREIDYNEITAWGTAPTYIIGRPSQFLELIGSAHQTE